MKLKFLFVLSVLAFALHSCSKDEPKVEANNPPVLEDTTLAIPENAASGTVLITLATTDEDGDALGYDVEGDPGPFNLSNIGVLTLSGELDYDETKTYTITINAYDSKSSASATFTINVTKVDPENQAPIIEDQGSAASELSTSEEVLHDVDAEDPEGSSLAFEITANDNNLFVINELGEIRLAEGKNLDFETQESHQITVTVSDGINTAEAVVTITVQNEIESLFEDPDAFLLKIMIETTNEEWEIGTFSEDPDLVYNFEIEWGDGNKEIITTNEVNHVYESAGTYYVAIKGQFPRIMMQATSEENRLKLLSVERWGKIEWESMSYAFSGCSNLESNTSDTPDLSKVTDMSSMFSGASSFNGDVSNWDVSNITNMSYMFAGAFAFNQYLGDWNISSIQNMDHMLDFSGLSITNYDNTLMNWAILIGQNDGPNNITLGANGLLYCDDNAKDARNGLIEFFGWTFEGDQECP